jgi:hypothetical protein
MSRGFGKWQRLILAELASRERFFLRELLPPDCRKADSNSLHRAARKPSDKGMISLHRSWFGAEK